MVQFQYVEMIFNTFKELTQENDGLMIYTLSPEISMSG